MPTTPGQEFLKDIIPSDIEWEMPLEGDNLKNLFQQLAEKRPDKYIEVLDSLNKVATTAATRYGRTASAGIDDLRPSPRLREYQKRIRERADKILQSDFLTSEQKNQKVVDLMKSVQDNIRNKVMDEEGNNFVFTAKHGMRGNPVQLTQMLFGDLLMADHKGRPIPIPGLHGYGEGVTPAEYWAGTYGSRAGIAGVQLNTQKSGYFCLHESTKVRMSDFSCKLIRDIRLGEWIMGADKEGRQFPVEVSNAWYTGVQDVNTYKFRKGGIRKSYVYLTCTEEHEVFGEIKRKGKKIKPAGKYRLKNVHDGFSAVPVQRYSYKRGLCRFLSSIRNFITGRRYQRGMETYDLADFKSSASGHVYDIEVDHPDHMFVLDNGLIVGNTNKLATLPHKVQVTGDDCGAEDVGIEVPGDSPDILGNVLAEDVAGIPKGTVINKNHLPKLGDKDVMIRSLLTCQQPEGICKKCAGQTATGRFPEMNEDIGVEYARLLGEPITQGALCLEENTEVRMNDGSTKKIRDIKPGEWVTGFDKEAGGTVPSRVTDVFNNGEKDIYRYKYIPSPEPLEIRCTEDHKILQAPYIIKPGCRGFKTELLPVSHGDSYDRAAALVKSFDEDGSVNYRAIQKGEAEYLGKLNTMDLEVDNKDHLFVLANGLIVSNSSKHVGGLVEDKDPEASFEALQQVFDIPQHFRGKAVLSPDEGEVKDIRESDEGGHYIQVGTSSAYIPQDRQILVSKGDNLEAGDVLSSGIPDPREITEYKGLGEGREHFLKQIKRMLDKYGVDSNIQSLEPLAREFFNRVEVTDPDYFEDYTKGDTVPYSDIQKKYVPRQDSYIKNPEYTKGKYLERPALKYSIGTKITPRTVKNLRNHGIKNIVVNDNPPPFKTKPMPIASIVGSDPDFKSRMGAWGLKKSLVQAAQQGSESPEGSTSYFKRLIDPSEL